MSFNDCFLIDEVFPFELLDLDQVAGNLRLFLIRKLHDDGGSDDGGGDALWRHFRLLRLHGGHLDDVTVDDLLAVQQLPGLSQTLVHPVTVAATWTNHLQLS